MYDVYMIDFSIIIMQIKYVFKTFVIANTSMKHHRRFTRTTQIANIIGKGNQIEIISRFNGPKH